MPSFLQRPATILRRFGGALVSIAKSPFLAHPIPAGLVVTVVGLFFTLWLTGAFKHSAEQSARTIVATPSGTLSTTSTAASPTTTPRPRTAPTSTLRHGLYLVPENDTGEAFGIQISVTSITLGVEGGYLVSFSLDSATSAKPQAYHDRPVGYFADIDGFRVRVQHLDYVTGQAVFSVRQLRQPG